MSTEETNFDRGYIKKKLEHGLTRIWQVWFIFMFTFIEAVVQNTHTRVVVEILVLNFVCLHSLQA